MLAAIGVLLSATLFIATTPVAAQTATGAISGVIQDAQGAIVPNAKVTLINDAQGAASARQITTGGEGGFEFSPLLPGTYTLSVEITGFKKYIQSGITLDVNDKLGLPADRAGSRRHRRIDHRRSQRRSAPDHDRGTLRRGDRNAGRRHRD